MSVSTAAASSSVAVFYEKDFPFYLSDKRADPREVMGWLRNSGIDAKTISAAGLSDHERFNIDRYKVLLLVYGNPFPLEAVPNVVKWRKDGGSIVSLGAVPFCHRVVRENGKWKNLGYKDFFMHNDGPGTGAFKWIDGVKNIQPTGGEKALGLDNINWPELQISTGHCVYEDKEKLGDKHEGMLALVSESGEVLGYGINVIRHECSEFKGCIDVRAGETAIINAPMPVIKQVTVKSTAYALNQLGCISDNDLRRVHAKVDEKYPADIKPLEPVYEKKPYNTIFPKTPEPSKDVLLLDLMDASREDRFMLTALQGLVNRRKPSIYIKQKIGWHGESLLDFWQQNLEKSGYKFTKVEDPYTLLKQFKGSYKGCILYDNGLWDDLKRAHGINVITLMCGIKDALPLTEEMNRTFNLPVLFDARGMWKDSLEAYTWAFENLWKDSNHFLLSHSATTSFVLRDYLVAFKVFPFFSTKDMTESEQELYEKIMATAPVNGVVMGCWGGYGEKPEGKYDEFELVGLCSNYGKMFVVTDGCANTTFHSGIRLPADQLKQKPRPKRQIEPGKVYVAFHISDGDNLQYVQGDMFHPKWWDSPLRGKSPIAWSFAPSIIDLLPDVAKYYFDTASPLDEMITPVSGAGYCYPQVYGSKFGTHRDKILKDFLKLTNQYMVKTGMPIMNPHGGSDKVYEVFEKEMPALTGILADYGMRGGMTYDKSFYMLDGRVPVFHGLVNASPTLQGEAQAKHIADEIKKMVGDLRPAFVHAFLVNWFCGSDVPVRAAELLGPDFVAVTPSEMVELAKMR